VALSFTFHAAHAHDHHPFLLLFLKWLSGDMERLLSGDGALRSQVAAHSAYALSTLLQLALRRRWPAAAGEGGCESLPV
jgi:hypothetical protein